MGSPLTSDEYTVTPPATEDKPKYSVEPPKPAFTVEKPQPLLTAQPPSQPLPNNPDYNKSKMDVNPLNPEAGKGDVKTGFWLLDALLGPDTFLGKQLRGTTPDKPSIEQREAPAGVMRTMAGPVGQSPLIDLSVGSEKGIPTGVLKAASGFTSPAQLPLMLAPGSRALSGLFAGATIPQFMSHYEAYQQAKKRGDEEGMQEAQGAMGADILMGSLAAYHSGNVGESTPVYKPSDFITQDELHYGTGLIQQHIEQSAANGDHAGVHEGVEGLGSLLARVASEKPDRRATMAELPQGQIERRSLEHTPEGQRVVYESMLLETIKQDERALAQTDISDEDKVRIAEHKADFQQMLDDSRSGKNEPPTQQATADILSREGQSPRGSGSPSPATAVNPAEASQLREEDIRANQSASGGERGPSATSISSPREAGDGGQTAEGTLDKLTSNITEIQSILPVFSREIAGLSRGEMEGGRTITGATDISEPPPPVISEAIDNDLSNKGIRIVTPGKDMWLTGRFLGALSESARLLEQQGHPLGPTLTSFTGVISDVTKAILKDNIDLIGGWKRSAKSIVSDKEWENGVVPLMDNPDITPESRPSGVPDNVWKAYTATRELDDSLRIGMRDAMRKRLALGGAKPKQVVEWVPDDWGMTSGHYPHAFPGEWTITHLAGVDEKGVEVYEPIDTGWRAASKFQAQEKAAEWLKDHPDSSIKVERDTFTLPGKNLSDRSKLIDLSQAIKEADKLVASGHDPEEVMKSLYNEGAAAAYGPQRIAPRRFGHALERESNLPGWARDMDNFEKYLVGSIRFIHLTPAREMLIQARNKIAELSGMPTIQRPSDIPSPLSYSSAKQFGNILARVDSAIEGLEGRPGFSDTAFKSVLNYIGADPNIINKAFRPVQSLTALAKLGFNPARVLSHGLQTLWAVYPVLGERYTLEGLANSFNPAYEGLIKDLGVTHSTSSSDLEGLRTYQADYFSRGTNPIDWTKGSLSIIKDVGLLPFTFGIESTRRIAAIGAYRQGLERGLPEPQARSYARDVLDRTTGMYNAADNSPFLRQLPGPVSQFKGFTLKTSQFIWGLRTPGEISRFFLATGLLGFTGLAFLKGLSNLIYNVTGEDVENDLKRAFPKSSRGVFGALGVDVPAGVGLGDLSITRDNSPLLGLGGPAVSDAIALTISLIEKAIKGPSRKAEGKLDDALRNLSPEARRLWDEGVRLAGKPSLTDPRTGSVIINNLSPKERIEMIAGLTPLRVATERDIHEDIRNKIEQAKDKRGYFVDRLAETELELARRDTTASQKAELIKQVVSLSHLAQEYGVGAGLPKAVIQRAKEMEMERLLRDVKKAPKAQRYPAYQEMKDFKESNPNE